MTRIVAGRFGGRRLVAPTGQETRPTSDRVREALFSALETRVDLDGARFADLYAGSGAVGLEALSRGAAHVLLVEADRRAASVIRGNITTLAVAPLARLVADRVERVVASAPAEPFDAIFVDPPYAMTGPEVTEVLTSLVTGGWLAQGAVVAVERSVRRSGFEWVPGVTPDGTRRYGETALWYGRRS